VLCWWWWCWVGGGDDGVVLVVVVVSISSSLSLFVFNAIRTLRLPLAPHLRSPLTPYLHGQFCSQFNFWPFPGGLQQQSVVRVNKRAVKRVRVWITCLTLGHSKIRWVVGLRRVWHFSERRHQNLRW
jgi:hypothetical protein